MGRSSKRLFNTYTSKSVDIDKTVFDINLIKYVMYLNVRHNVKESVYNWPGSGFKENKSAHKVPLHGKVR